MKQVTGRDAFRAAWFRPAILLLVGFVWLLQSAAALPLTWNIQTVDSAESVGWFTSLALDAAGNTHISYYDTGNDDLKYAVWNGTSWDTETVASGGDVGWYTSLALDAAGHPRISYFDVTNGDLKYAAWNGTSWDLSTVDSVGNVGWYTSLALDAAGHPRISYYAFTNDALKVAAWNGTSWVLETVDSVGNVGYHTSLALDAAGHPRISYFDVTNGDLKVAAWNGTSWVLETVDSAGTVGSFNSLALDAAGNPRISYYDVTNVDLKVAAWNGTSWGLETVDSAGFVGSYTSLALDAAGNPRISYYDGTNADLKVAAWNGTSWDLATVDSDEGVGTHSSLALDAAGDPRISYFDVTNADLKVAVGLPPTAQLTITKSVAGSGAPADWSFAFTGGVGAFSLTDESPSTTHANLTPGTLAVTETNPAGYATSASCDNGASSADGNLSLTLAAGDDVECTFTNTICQPGSYDTSLTWACADAQPGYYADTPGASTQISCPPGFYQPNSGQTSCFEADPGFYAPWPGATQQTACPAGTTSPPGSDTIDDCVSTAPDLYLSTKAAGTTGDGLDFGPEDIVRWDGSTWSTWFDGSAALLLPNKATHNINAFWIPDGDGADVIMSFAQNRRFVPDVAAPVDGMDLVRWDGSAFSFWFDGSDVFLTNKTQEKIDALHVLPGGESPIGSGCLAYLLVSTQGPGKVPNYSGGQLKFQGEDVLGFCATSLGEATAGLWHMVLDGSAVGLPRNATDSISLSDDGETLYLTTQKAVDLGGGVAGGHSTVFAYDLDSQTFSGPLFSAPANGLPKQVTGLHVDGPLP